MKNFTSAALNKYQDASYEIKERARLLFIFFTFLIPSLVVFVVTLNVIQERELTSMFNVILILFIIISIVTQALLLKGYYNAAANILVILVIIGLVFNARGMIKEQSFARFSTAHMAFAAPIVFCVLFCKLKIFITTTAIAFAGIIFNVLGTDFLKPEERLIVFVTMSLIIFLIFILGYLIISVNAKTRNLRKSDFDNENKKQLDINRELLVSLASVSSSLDDSSKNMAENSLHFSENIQKQSVSIEEITATIEELASGSENITDNVLHQFDSMKVLMEKVETVSSISSTMSSRISGAINLTSGISGKAQSGETNIRNMNSSITEISSTSAEMSGILSIINDISDRINLLSLNASIEAARAGEAGRGFAVVADEIGKLADQTSSSVKNIASLIKKSESEVNKGMVNVKDTVSVIREIIQGVTAIHEMMSSIEASMSENILSNKSIADEAAKANILAESIKNATIEQKKALDEIMTAVTYINELSQSNSAGAEEISANSDDILRMSGDVKEKVNRFTIPD